MNGKNRLNITIILTTILFLNSCVLTTATIVGASLITGGTFYYYRGIYIIEVPSDLRTVYNSAIKTIQMNEKYSLKNQSFDHKSAEIEAYESTNQIHVELTKIKDRNTEIKIRYGTIGNEQKSAELANNISKNIY